MRDILIGLVSGIALLGLAACGDGGDGTETQGIDQGGGATQEAPADGGAGGDMGGGADTGGAAGQ